MHYLCKLSCIFKRHSDKLHKKLVGINMMHLSVVWIRLNPQLSLDALSDSLAQISRDPVAILHCQVGLIININLYERGRLICYCPKIRSRLRAALWLNIISRLDYSQELFKIIDKIIL